MIPSYMIELRKLMDKYSTSKLNSFMLKNLFLVALEQLGDSLEEIQVLLLVARCFWYDNSPLCEAFPTLYRIADSKGAIAAELWVGDEGMGAWNPNFIRLFND